MRLCIVMYGIKVIWHITIYGDKNENTYVGQLVITPQ